MNGDGRRGRVTWRRGAPIAGVLAGVALLLVIVLTHIDIRADMTDLLPRGQTEAERFLLGELRTGPATGIVLVGLENATPAQLARISRAMAAALDRSGLFTLVSNGDTGGAGAADQAFLFAHRYLLSPATASETFTIEALRADFQRIFGLLQSSASPLVARYGLADPTGASLALLRIWSGTSNVRIVGGVWFAADRDRALLLAKLRSAGMDVSAEELAVQAIEAAFTAARPGGARLLATGPAIFSRDAARGIRADVHLLSAVSALLVCGLLFWRFRSLLVIAVIAIPILLGFAMAALVVQLAFGFVHGVALGFGMTMLGVTVDYPVLLIGHRKTGEAAAGTLRRIGQAFTLAVLTAVLGLMGMLLSGFPGLVQLGLFSVIGLLVAAAATRWLLPPLIVAADLAPVSFGSPERLLRIERLRALRGPAGALCGLAALYLLIERPVMRTDLAALSPVPPAALARDAEIRGEIGAPDAGQVGVIRGETAQAVLEAEERLLPVLDNLQKGGAITGAELAARFLPSVKSQRARQEALPDPAELSARVAAAGAGLPFRPGAFQPFIDDVAAATRMQPIEVADLPGVLARARVGALLFERPDGWHGLIAPTGVHDAARVAAALREADVTYIDMGGTANAIVSTYARSALLWLAVGAVLATGVLLVGLRDGRRVARVVASISAAGLLTVALLTALGAPLSLISIVSLQFVGGVGLDYALFFGRRQLDAEERARTLRTLATCNAMAVMTFGLLAFCRTPLLRDIGQTVVIGTVAALCLSFLFAGPRPGREAT